MGQDVSASGAGQGAGETVIRKTVIRKTVASYTYQRSVYQVHQEFDQLDPAQISTACTGWKAAADELLALADDLKARIAVPLDAAWSSPSSPAAQFHLQQAEATARALAADCLQMAHATDYAANYAAWYKANLPSYTDAVATGVKGAVTGQGLTAGADAATEHLVQLLGRYNEVIQILPAAVRSTVPAPGIRSTDDPLIHKAPTGQGGAVPAPSGGANSVSGAARAGITAGGQAWPGGSAGVGAAQGGGGGGTGSGTGAGIAGGTQAPAPIDPYAAGSSLAGSGLGGGVSGFDPTGLGSAPGGAGHGSGGGLGAGPAAGAWGATGLGAGGLAAGLGAGRTGTGLGTGAFAGPGAGGAGPGGLAGQAGAGAGGTGMMPMQGAGGQGEDEERQRSSWLTEDADLGGTDGDIPPPVITE